MAEILKAAWRDLREGRAAFAFAFSAALLFAPGLVVYFALQWAISSSSGLTPAGTSVGPLAPLAMMGVCGLLFAPAYVLFSSGITWLSQRRFDGTEFTSAEAWRAGIGLFPRVFRFYLLIAASWALAYLVVGGVLYVSFSPMSGSGQSAFPVGFCFAFPLMLLLVVAASLTLNVVSALGVRRVAIGDEPAQGAFWWAWGTLNAQRGKTVGFALVLGLIGYAWSLLLSPITFALSFASAGTAPGAGPSPAFLIGSALSYLVVGLGQLPYVLYTAYAWTRFYHQLLEPPPAIGAFIDAPAPPPPPQVQPPDPSEEAWG